MLLEHIPHYNNLHFAVNFSNVAQEAPHYHKEAEIALVLRGFVNYKIYHQNFHAESGDIIVVDTQDLHYIYDSSDDVILLTFYIDMEAFSDLYPNIEFMIFACEEFNEEASLRHQKLQNKIAFMAHHLAEMMTLCQNSNTADHQLTAKLHEIVYMMVNQFQGFFIENNEFRYGGDHTNPLNLERLARIISYIDSHYDEKITLSDLAEKEHLNMYHISHLIKETTGLSFQNLLNYMRLEFAEKLLNEEKLTLTQISECCGFSSPSYFNKCFKQWYGITPVQYKKESRPKERICHGNLNIDEAMQLLHPYLNTSLPENHTSDRGYSSQHIFIPMKSEYSERDDFHKTFPLNIRVSTEEEICRLICCKDALTALRPALLSLPKSVISSPAAQHLISGLRKNGARITVENEPFSGSFLTSRALTAADVFDCISKNTDFFVKAAGKSGSLFTEAGLPTPVYSLYKIFSDINGTLVEQQEQYILTRDRDFFSLMICNSSDQSALHVHLQFQLSEKPNYVIRKALNRKHSIFHLLDRIGIEQATDYHFREFIESFISGTNEILFTEVSPGRSLDFSVEPDTLLILCFHEPDSTE